jgi:hypothetical protein
MSRSTTRSQPIAFSWQSTRRSNVCEPIPKWAAPRTTSAGARAAVHGAYLVLYDFDVTTDAI